MLEEGAGGEAKALSNDRERQDGGARQDGSLAAPPSGSLARCLGASAGAGAGITANASPSLKGISAQPEAKLPAKLCLLPRGCRRCWNCTQRGTMSGTCRPGTSWPPLEVWPRLKLTCGQGQGRKLVCARFLSFEF